MKIDKILKTKLSGTEIKNNFLFFAAIAIFVALLFRNSGLYPVVADEAIYSKASRLQPLADSGVPEYIYLAIYRLTNICGDGFLDCARILNAIFFCCGHAPYLSNRPASLHTKHSINRRVAGPARSN